MGLLEALDAVGLVALEASHGAVVLDAHDELASGCVGEGHQMLGYLARVLSGALAVEVVPLWVAGKGLYVVFGVGMIHLLSISAAFILPP